MNQAQSDNERKLRRICVKLAFVKQKTSNSQRRVSPWILGILVLVFLTVLILLQSSNLWKEFSVDTASDTLLLYALSSLNFIAFVIFGFIFLRSIIKLARERRAFQLGARIKTRLLLYFAAISLLPIIAMAGFSYLFMNRALDRWFTQIPENVVREVGAVQSQALQEQADRLQETAKMLAANLERRDFSDDDLRTIAEAGNLTLVEILSKENKSISISETSLNREQKVELERTLANIRAGALTEPSMQDGRGFDAAIAPMTDGRKLLIVPQMRDVNSVTGIVESSLSEFDRLKDEQIIIRQIGFLTLGVLTFLLIFASTWTAFYIARGLTVPIKALAEGADEIAQGNLAHRVNVFAEDELALLVSTFNQMSGRLEENSAELNERQKYIETVLQSLPSGVISFDSENVVSTINRAAINILKLEDADFSSSRLENLVSKENRNVLERLLSRAKRIGHASEQTVLRIETTDGTNETEADLPVALIATALPDENGAVLVIEDLSELIAAQRASAWQEVARRMAHEIKNPLTPIQLSAERIAKRFAQAPRFEFQTSGKTANDFEPSNQDGSLYSTDNQTLQVVTDGTATILREVNSLKSMVDEFSRFARLPNAQLESGNINELIRQVLALYEDRTVDVVIEQDLAGELPDAMIDPEQLKRVFVNLIENAIEAFDDSQDIKRVVVSTRNEAARDLIAIEIADNGSGIARRDFQKLFQPYFSTKGRGTGLGLAIVHRIVTEHHGTIQVVANQSKGAKFIIEIPLIG